MTSVRGPGESTAPSAIELETTYGTMSSVSKVKLSVVGNRTLQVFDPADRHVVNAVGRRRETEVDGVGARKGETGGLVAIDREVAVAHARKQNVAAECDGHLRDLIADIRAGGGIGRGHRERGEPTGVAGDADRVFAQVRIARAHDLEPVVAGRSRHVVDDVVDAVGRVAGRGGDQVAIAVIEVDRGARSLANCNPLALGTPGVVVVIVRLSPALTLNEYQSALLPPGRRRQVPTPQRCRGG